MSNLPLMKFFALLVTGLLCSAQESYGQVPVRHGSFYYIPYRTQEQVRYVPDYQLSQSKAWYLLDRAVSEMNSQNYQTAEIYFSQYLLLMSGDYRAIICRGICRYMNNDLHYATKDLRRAIAMNREENKDLYKLIGSIYCEEGKYKKAIRYMKKSLHHFPDDAETYNNMGKCYQEMKDLTNAYQYYNKALELDSTNALVFNNRGSVVNFAHEYMQRPHPDDISGALVDFEKALSLDSNLEIAWRNKGVAYTLLQKYDLALEALNKAISLDSTDYLAFYQRSILYSKMKRFEEAEADIFRCMTYDLVNIQAVLIERGNIFLYREQFDEAQAYFAFYAKKSFQHSFKATMCVKAAQAYALDNNAKKAIKYLKMARHKGYFRNKIYVQFFLTDPHFKNLDKYAPYLDFREKVGKILL